MLSQLSYSRKRYASLATSSEPLTSSCDRNLLLDPGPPNVPVNLYGGGGGFEPPKSTTTDYSCSPLAARESLQNDPAYNCLTGAGDGTRTRNLLITSHALPIELRQQSLGKELNLCFYCSDKRLSSFFWFFFTLATHTLTHCLHVLELLARPKKALDFLSAFSSIWRTRSRDIEKWSAISSTHRVICQHSLLDNKLFFLAKL